MKNKITTIALLALGVIATSAFQNYSEQPIEVTQKPKVITIDGVGITRTLETNGNEIIKIEGTNNKINVIGSCSKIDIEGTENYVQASLVGEISIEGANNTVYYTGSPYRNKKTATHTEGVDNVVQIRK